jgi:hypothetical protein
MAVEYRKVDGRFVIVALHGISMGTLIMLQSTMN